MLSVEYRCIPEHLVPTPLEDGYAALKWLREHADEFGVDVKRIAVMGTAPVPAWLRAWRCLPGTAGARPSPDRS